MNRQLNSKTGSRGIEWTDFTWNMIRGCLHGCVWVLLKKEAKCYAKITAENGVAKKFYPEGFEHHYFDKNNQDLQKRKTPALVFIDSMSDLFGHWVPKDDVHAVLDQVSNSPQHIAQALTKNAPGILKYLDDLPSNLWVGVSSPPDEMWGQKLDLLKQQKMLVRELKVLQQVKERRPDLTVWMSIEPLSWDISDTLRDHPVLDEQQVPVCFKGNLKWPRWREDFPAIDHPALRRRKEQAEKHGWTASRY